MRIVRRSRVAATPVCAADYAIVGWSRPGRPRPHRL